MSALELLLQQLINAVSIGSLYALMAIGLAMVFGILRLINFAHGDLIMVGSYVALLLLLLGLPFPVAAVAGVAASTLAGLLMERLAYRPSARRARDRDAAHLLLRDDLPGEPRDHPVPPDLPPVSGPGGPALGLRVGTAARWPAST